MILHRARGWWPFGDMINKMASLGEMLLADEESKDFLLVMFDGSQKISVMVHRLILKVNSAFFKRTLNSLYQLSYVWIIPENAFSEAAGVLKYFYTHNKTDLMDNAMTGVLLAQHK